MDVEKVAKAITYLRKRAGYTQRDLATRLGVSDKAVSRWERGLGLPDVSLLGKISILLDTDTDSLLSGDVIHHDKGWHGLLILDENACGIGPETIIYDKPLLYYLLSYFLLVGIRQIKVVCSQSAREYIQREIMDQTPFEFVLSFSDCVSSAARDEAFMTCENLMIVFGKSIIYGVDMTRFLQKAMADKSRITLLTLPKGTKGASSYIRFDTNKKIVPEDHDDQMKTQYNYCDMPVLFCPRAQFARAFSGQRETGDLSALFRNQDVYIEALDRGFVEINIQSWDDVAEASSFVQIVQRHCGMVIYCLEEVAWRRGLLSFEALTAAGERKKETYYGKYMLQLSDLAGAKTL